MNFVRSIIGKRFISNLVANKGYGSYEKIQNFSSLPLELCLIGQQEIVFKKDKVTLLVISKSCELTQNISNDIICLII